jgi:uncharacterized protein
VRSLDCADRDAKARSYSRDPNIENARALLALTHNQLTAKLYVWLLALDHAVRGNVDHGAWSANLLVTQRIEIDGFRIYVLHILAELDPQAADNVDAVIYGHSHQPKIETKNGTLFFNPGSAGPRRFRLPITVGRMTAEHGKLRAEIVELSVER